MLNYIRKVAFVWGARQGSFVHNLEGALLGGEKDLIRAALQKIFEETQFEETPSGGDWGGSSWKINADWFYALGPRQQNRVQSTLQGVFDLLRISDTPRLIQRTRDLLPDIVWLEKQNTMDEGFLHGPFKVHVVGAVKKEDVQESLKALDASARLIEQKFPYLLYGDIYLSPRVGGNSQHVVALYTPSGDNIYLSMKAKKTTGDVHAICHEFGHRYFQKYWRDSEAKSRFHFLSTQTEYVKESITSKQRDDFADQYIELVGKTSRSASPQLEAYLTAIATYDKQTFNLLRGFTQNAREGRETLEELGQRFRKVAPLSWDTDKVIREPLAVTPYGARGGWMENFSEAFAHYLMGQPLHPEMQTLMESLG